MEELWHVYPKEYFHIVYVSNALDHSPPTAWVEDAFVGAAQEWDAAASLKDSDHSHAHSVSTLL